MPERYKPNAKAPRTPAREVGPQERVQGFMPVDLGYTDDDAVLEANRCLDCARPLCVQGCPVGVDIPHFIEAIRARDWERGLDIVRRDNLLPSVCGRVCPQETQCEGACVLAKRGNPIAIGQLERFLGDKADEFAGGAAADSGASEANVVGAAPRRVAVVGSGPAGITCAFELARAGVEVTIFDSLFRLGGVLVYGIPEFRLPKAVVARELEALEALGVRVETNMVAGRTFTVDELLGERGFDAVFIGVGAGLPKMLGVPGENACGVMCANEYLTRVNLMRAYDFPQVDTPVRPGKNVVVFGGGNVAMDAARTALRLGAETVTLCYRRTEAEMPARRAEIEHAKAEGVRLMELVGPLGFEADEAGNVCAARLQRMELGEPDEGGRRRPVALTGQDAIAQIPCDLAITAIGTNACPLVGAMAPSVALNRWGYIEADEDGRTSQPGVWAGGDIVTGAATVILAMGAGKRSAHSILESFEA
ncbi:MAG: NADPH-dependent glutamate synthase [Coriobacteriaceae bacterium]|nr:NADPH-dependent glutamate synthase [Coriobacteriaceae bacterium]